MLSAPSPCERCCRLQVLWADLTPGGSSAHLVSARLCLPAAGAVVSGRLRPTSVSGFPLAWLNSRMPCNTAFPQPDPIGSPKFLTLLSTHPTLFVDPGRPSEISPKKTRRSLCIGFWGVNTIAICMTLFYEAVSSFGECGLPCGLRGSLCTLQLFRSALHRCFLHSCNTRYEWLVRPCSAGTSTLQEAPSFAWRTNAPAQGQGPNRELSRFS